MYQLLKGQHAVRRSDVELGKMVTLQQVATGWIDFVPERRDGDTFIGRRFNEPEGRKLVLHFDDDGIASEVVQA